VGRAPRGEPDVSLFSATARGQFSGWEGEVKKLRPLGSRCLTLALRCEAAVASAKEEGDATGEHHAEPTSGFVSFNAGLADAGAVREARAPGEGESEC